MKQKIYGWHFCGATLRDGLPIPKDGEWLKHTGDVRICKSGLHFSDTPFEALEYAPGATLCYVELRDVVERQSDKGVACERRIISRMDATELLRYFARMQAVSVVHLLNAAPPEVVLDYLMTGDEELRDAARAAAWAAAWDAARDAARAAAWDAAWDAARDAVWDAARDEFNAIVYECFGLDAQ